MSALTFDVLSDVGNEVARRFGLVWSLPEELRAALRSNGKALPGINDDESWELPVPATYAIAPDGRVAIAAIEVDYHKRLEPDAILAALGTPNVVKVTVMLEELLALSHAGAEYDACDRFAMEVKRQLDVLDRLFAECEYLVGSDYTIADMAVFPWYGGRIKGWQYRAAEFLSVLGVQERAALGRGHLRARLTVKRGRKVNRMSGDPSEQLRERHDASDFGTFSA